MEDAWLMQPLGAHQHNLQYLRWWFQAKIWIKICLKFLIFLKICKNRQALEVSPPNPNGPPAAGGSAPRPASPVQSYPDQCCIATKRFKFIALFKEGFKEKILVKTFFWRTHCTFENIFYWTFGQILPALKLL